MATTVTVHVDTGDSAITLGIALVSLLVGATALSWQILTWRLSTSRVTASLKWAARNGTMLMTMPPTREYPSEWFEAQGFTSPALAADIRNKGRSTAFIENYSIHLANGTEIGWVSGSGTLAGVPSMPIRLEPEASARVFVELAGTFPYIAMASVVAGNAKAEIEAWMVVQTGTGKSVATKEKVLVGAPPELVERAREIVARGGGPQPN